MSRLFSRLENMGQDQSDGALPDSPPGAGRPEVVRDDVHAIAETYRDKHAVAVSAETPIMRPLVPGYAVSSSLGMAAPLAPVVARPVWPVRLWLLSLLILSGLSLAILAMPERLLPFAAQSHPSTSAVPDDTVPASPASGTATVARPDRAPASSAAASTSVTPAPAPSAARAEPHDNLTAAAPPPATITAVPLPPAADAACSEAMRALNLCSKPSP